MVIQNDRNKPDKNSIAATLKWQCYFNRTSADKDSENPDSSVSSLSEQTDNVQFFFSKRINIRRNSVFKKTAGNLYIEGLWDEKSRDANGFSI